MSVISCRASHAFSETGAKQLHVKHRKLCFAQLESTAQYDAIRVLISYKGYVLAV